MFSGKIGIVCRVPSFIYFCVMNLFRIVVELFGLYLLYKLIFDVIIPFAGAYRKAKKQFGEMRDRGQNRDMNPENSRQNSSNSGRKDPPVGDYIDFEEIK